MRLALVYLFFMTVVIAACGSSSISTKGPNAALGSITILGYASDSEENAPGSSDHTSISG